MDDILVIIIMICGVVKVDNCWVGPVPMCHFSANVSGQWRVCGHQEMWCGPGQAHPVHARSISAWPLCDTHRCANFFQHFHVLHIFFYVIESDFRFFQNFSLLFREWRVLKTTETSVKLLILVPVWDFCGARDSGISSPFHSGNLFTLLASCHFMISGFSEADGLASWYFLLSYLIHFAVWYFGFFKYANYMARWSVYY